MSYVGKMKKMLLWIFLFSLLVTGCVAVLPNYTPAVNRNREADILNKICSYFNQGFSYAEILGLLASIHNCVMSLRSLKRRLKRLGLKRPRRNIESPLHDIVAAIIEEMNGSVGSFSGYRDMWLRLKIKHKLSVRRDTVMEAMRVIDPEGVALRKRHRLKRRKYITPGPNFLWHIDGWDKLKPYGFSVHGCMDGFSRRLLWLEVGSTNKDPAVCLTYFLDTVRQIKGIPKMIRMDNGSENGCIADMQTLLRLLNDEIENAPETTCVLMGKSSANQRIESYWSKLRSGGGGWWMDFFKDLRDSGVFDDTDPVHCECLKFCFMPVIRKELYSVAQMWNLKDIHVPKNSELHGGKPDVMYFMPEAYGTRNYIVNVNEEELVLCKRIYGKEVSDYSPKFGELLDLMGVTRETPTNTEQALSKFVAITEQLKLYND